MIRRRLTSVRSNDTDSSEYDDDDDSSSSSGSSRWSEALLDNRERVPAFRYLQKRLCRRRESLIGEKRRRSFSVTIWRFLKSDASRRCNCFASTVLCAAIAVWGLTLLSDGEQHTMMNVGTDRRIRQTYSQPENRKGRFTDGNGRPNGLRAEHQAKKPNVERLQEGCMRPKWQEFSFPTCNDLHDIDLRNTYQERLRRHRSVDTNAEPIGYMAEGMWRTVWAVEPRQGIDQEPLVLKMMKSEHEVDKRNLERHRRDALVMERLTSSPFVVDIFGYCGNSVLTEYIATSLQDIISDKWNRTLSYPSRLTSKGRIELALGTAEGVKALHEIDGGPIVHADLQAQQFLVTPAGRVKINDFNRCRFVAQNNVTGKPCSFRIPTAPGRARAPEEYDFQELSEKIDIFSLANVFHYILSGEDPWADWSTIEVKTTVMQGIKPFATEEFREKGTTDEKLQNITLRAYELDPGKRIDAASLVRDLKKLVTA